MLNYL
jgi:hypothetical protein